MGGERVGPGELSSCRTLCLSQSHTILCPALCSPPPRQAKRAARNLKGSPHTQAREYSTATQGSRGLSTGLFRPAQPSIFAKRAGYHSWARVASLLPNNWLRRPAVLRSTAAAAPVACAVSAPPDVVLQTPPPVPPPAVEFTPEMLADPRFEKMLQIWDPQGAVTAYHHIGAGLLRRGDVPVHALLS